MNQTETHLKSIWKRTGLAFSGHSFQDDIKNPMLAKCMQNALEAQRRKHQAPAQSNLNFEGMNHA